MPFLAAIREAKLRTFVLPGQTLDLSAEMIHEGSGFAVTRASITIARKLACSADLTFRVMEFPGPVFRGHMESMAARLRFPMEVLADG